MTLSIQHAEEVEKVFRACYDLTTQAKDATSSKNDLLSNLAKSLQVDKKILRSAFVAWSDDEKKLIQESGNELLEALEVAKPRKIE